MLSQTIMLKKYLEHPWTKEKPPPPTVNVGFGWSIDSPITQHWLWGEGGCRLLMIEFLFFGPGCSNILWTWLSEKGIFTKSEGKNLMAQNHYALPKTIFLRIFRPIWVDVKKFGNPEIRFFCLKKYVILTNINGKNFDGPTSARIH